MKRNAIPTASGHLHARLVLATVFLLAGCGKPHSANLEVRHKPHSVTLSWKASTSKVVGYNVYRSYPPGAPFIKLTPQSVPAIQYIDTTVKAGNTYMYYVTSVNSKGVESRPSGQVAITVPIP